MNLKEAFRYQNHLKTLLNEATSILRYDANVTKVTNRFLRSKVNPDAVDETVDVTPVTDYSDHINEIVEFASYIIDERAKLAKAIRDAKNSLEMDIDSEVGLNGDRQRLAGVLRHMADIRATEQILSNGGYGYKFNADGEQVQYKCDVERITTINFNRKTVRKAGTDLGSKADKISAEIDAAIVNTEVAYEPPFDVNDSFDTILEDYLENRKTE